jgi:hypothetical protein
MVQFFNPLKSNFKTHTGISQFLTYSTVVRYCNLPVFRQNVAVKQYKVPKLLTLKSTPLGTLASEYRSQVFSCAMASACQIYRNFQHLIQIPVLRANQ